MHGVLGVLWVVVGSVREQKRAGKGETQGRVVCMDQLVSERGSFGDMGGQKCAWLLWALLGRVRALLA